MYLTYEKAIEIRKFQSNRIVKKAIYVFVLKRSVIQKFIFKIFLKQSYGILYHKINQIV